MSQDKDMRRGVAPAMGVQGGEHLRRRLSSREAPAAQPVHTTWNINRLMLQRAVDSVNHRRGDQLPHGTTLHLECGGTTATLSLVRHSDAAVIHKSRPLPLAHINQSNIHGIVRDFIAYKSLERFENPL